MTDPDRNIYTNPLPSSNIPVLTIPHPVRATTNAVKALPKSLRERIPTVKGEFGEVGDNVAFSFRSSPAVSRIRIEYVHPQTVEVYENGRVIPVEHSQSDLFSGLRNTPSKSTQARGVEKFSAIFTRDGNFLGTPRIDHHVQSTSFQGNPIQDRSQGIKAGRFHAVDILEGLERFGIDYLESIMDDELRAKVAATLVEVRDFLSNPRQNFGPESALPRLTPDAMQRSDQFGDYLQSVVSGKPFERPATGFGLA